MASAGLPAVPHPTARLVGTSPAMDALRAQIRHLATFDTVGSALVPTLLLQGETGTGKGLVARVVHDSGPRVSGPFVDVNCAAIPETMLEAELFGFEPGAFTDAKRAKPGLFEAASGGTLLLDEIDALPLALQGKLLTALEAKRVRRLGAVADRAVDVKLIAATNAALEQLIAAGRFRTDLYHRLAVVVLALPPLRARGEDVLVLAQALLHQYTVAHGVPPKRLTPDAVAWLQSYAWPGNVRELSHLMERVALLHVGEEVEAATLAHLCLPGIGPGSREAAAQVLSPAPHSPLPAEAEQLRQALAQTRGNVVQAARLLGVSRDTVRYRMQRYGMQRPRPARTSPPGSAISPPSASPPVAPAPAPLDAPPQEGSLASDPPPPVGGEPTPAPSTAEPSPEMPPLAEERRLPEPATVWEQKSVAVLALEVTWPEVLDLAPQHYEPWTEAARWDQAIREKVQGFGGVLLQHTTSLLTWVFGIAQALDQLAQRAVHSALAIRQMVAEASGPDMAPCPQVRLAVHLGAVRVQGLPPTAHVLAVGETLALPVRLLGQAAAGEILVSPGVGRLVTGWVALEERALQLQAGPRARMGGYAVVGSRPGRATLTSSSDQARTPFVGRERELALLEAVWEQVTAGQGQVVGLVGAPGLGKSRFLAEWQQRCRAQGTPYYAGECLAYGSATPYLPVLGLLREYCGLTEGDRPEAITAKVHLALEASGSDLEFGVPVLLDLLGIPVAADRLAGLSAEARRARTFATLRQMFLASSQRQPLVLAVDNLHWIDPTSETFLALLIEQIAGVPLLVLTTARPGYRSPWGDRSYVTQLALAPLDREASRQVVRRILTDRPLVPALEQQLLAKAEGNPFFLEELAHTVREQAGPQAVLAIPDTIQAVLAARLDRVPAPEQRLLQAAAVIGKEVTLPLLQALLALPEAMVQRRLAHLQAAEFVFPKSIVPTPIYAFKHILTQEAVYQAMPMTTRRQDHQQVARLLETQFPEVVESQPELLAHHYTEAGLGEPAVVYWQRAGQRAVERSAHPEAIAHLSTGLEVVRTLPDTPERAQHELVLQTALGLALIATRGYGSSEGERVHARARELSQQVGDTPQLFSALNGLWVFYLVRAELHTARVLAEQLLDLAQGQRNLDLLVEAHRPLGYTLFHLGEFARSREVFEQGIALYDPQQHRSHALLYGQDPKVGCASFLALTLEILGYPDQAIQRSHEALTLAQELAHPLTFAFAPGVAARLYQLRREAEVAQKQTEACMALSAEHGFAYWLTTATTLRGWTLAEQGRRAEGMVQLRQGMDACGATGAALLRPYFLALLAEMYGNEGQIAQGLRVLSEALAVVEQTGERCYAAECYRIKGELLRRVNEGETEGESAAEAETCLYQALDIARRQQAKLFELRAAISLGRLWQQQDKCAAAHALLAPIYGWFTEGFETRDLQDAKALLDALG